MKVAGVKGLEPSTYRVTGDRSNQLSYTPTLLSVSYTHLTLPTICSV